MPRFINDLPSPDSVPIAPHRYKWSGTIDADGNVLGDIALAKDYSAALACIPYKKGEAVYVAYGAGHRIAYISGAFVGRDFYGDRREQYRVHTLNANGKAFSKRWYYAYPGFIQRGYKRAGLAPDIPTDEM